MANTAAENVHPKISCSDLPGIFQAAEEVSASGQKTYARLFQVDLVLLVFVSGLFIFASPDHVVVYWVIAGFYAGAVATTLGLRNSQSKKLWYRGRALAESAKTLSWRFIMRADCGRPSESGASSVESSPEDTFLEKMKEILEKAHTFDIVLPAKHVSKPLISTKMRTIRALGWPDRLQVYLDQRVRDQLNWYGGKADTNRRDRQRWLAGVLVAQSTAALFAAATALGWSWAANTPGFFSATAAGLLAWLQLKQHDELGQAYGVAAGELSVIAEQARAIDSEKSLASYVASAETAMSREHTLWLARRDQAVCPRGHD